MYIYVCVYIYIYVYVYIYICIYIYPPICVVHHPSLVLLQRSQQLRHLRCRTHQAGSLRRQQRAEELGHVIHEDQRRPRQRYIGRSPGVAVPLPLEPVQRGGFQALNALWLVGSFGHGENGENQGEAMVKLCETGENEHWDVNQNGKMQTRLRIWLSKDLLS